MELKDIKELRGFNLVKCYRKLVRLEVDVNAEIAGVFVDGELKYKVQGVKTTEDLALLDKQTEETAKQLQNQ